MSINPGTTIRSVASISAIADCGLRIAERSAIRPSTITRSTTSSPRFAGSITRPLRMIVVLTSRSSARRKIDCQSVRPADMLSAFAVSAECNSAGRTGQRPMFHSCGDSAAQIENGHPNGEAVGDLVENDTLIAIGYFAVNFDPAINWTWMHDKALRSQKFGAFFG